MPLLLMLEGPPAAAQAACPSGMPPLNCSLLQDQQPYLQSFSNLPSFTAGTQALTANLGAIQTIYATGTAAQQQQALINATTGPIQVPQSNIWGMISNLPTSSFPLNAAAFSSVFPSISQSANLATTLSTQTAAQSAPVYPQISNLINSMWGQIQQVDGLKGNFTSYNTYYVQGQGLINPTWGGTIAAPNSTDLRPYQVSNAIGTAPWSPQLTASGGQWPGNISQQAFMSGHSALGNTTALIYGILQPEAYQSLMVSAQQFGLSRNILGVHYPLDIIGGRILAYYTVSQLLANTPLYSQAWSSLTGTAPFPDRMNGVQAQLNAQLGTALTAVPYANCAGRAAVKDCIAAGVFPTAAQFTTANQAYAVQATYGLPSIGPTNAAAVVPANAWMLLATRFPYLSAAQINDVLAGTELPSGGVLDDGSGWVRLNLYAAAGGYGAFTSNVSVTMDASLKPPNTSQPGYNAIDVWSNNISGPGSFTLQGSGTLVLAGNNTYTGGTTVGCATGIGCATLALTGSMIGNLTINQGASFVNGGTYSVSLGAQLSNAGTYLAVGSTLLNQGTLINSGSMESTLINSGTVANTGTMTGAIVNYGSFTNNSVVNGAFTNLGTLSGTGTMVGNVTNGTGGTVAPGGAGIGTLSVAGTYTHTAGSTYSPGVAVNGQSDLLVVSGTAAIQGGNVVVYAQPGTTYGASTTYTILNAAGGLSGTFASVNELYPFLLSSLSYDANNAYLTLQIGGFTAVAATPTQAAVGNVLDANVNTATGDFANVLSAMATGVQSNATGQYVLQQLSGNNYAGFSSSMVQGAQLFMNNFAGQVGGGGPLGSGRVALAEACDVACDSVPPATWGAWGGALGGLGTIGAGQPAGAVTYNAGGFAAGLDRALTESVRLGVTAGYTTGTQWVSGFDGLGRTDTFQVGVYGNYAQDKVYADALFGYAYSWNQMWRNISIPGLQQRTALGQTGANQWYGQLETGYRFDIGTAALAFVTPFARLQGYTGTQNAFTETGAQSLNLSVAQQTTNSLRSVLGAQLGGSVDLGWRERLALQLRLGWSHEYASTARPVTATLAGAPAMPFTTWGVSPTRDGVLVGFGATTAIAEATSVYLRYEGNIAGQDSAHALTAGLRMTW